MRLATSMLLVFIILTFFTCCPREDGINYELSDQERQLLPYLDGQRLAFSRDDGTIVEFSVRRKFNNVALIEDCDRCCPGNHWQVDSVRFDAVSNSVDFSNATISFPTILLGGDRSAQENFRGLRFLNRGPLPIGRDDCFSESACGLRMPIDQSFHFVTGPVYHGDAIAFAATVGANGKLYHDVFRYTQDVNAPPLFVDRGTYLEGISQINVWYNQSYGVIKYAYRYTRFVDAGNVIEKEIAFTLK